jgi:hypothetical protein
VGFLNDAGESLLRGAARLEKAGEVCRSAAWGCAARPPRRALPKCGCGSRCAERGARASFRHSSRPLVRRSSTISRSAAKLIVSRSISASEAFSIKPLTLVISSVIAAAGRPRPLRLDQDTNRQRSEEVAPSAHHPMAATASPDRRPGTVLAGSGQALYMGEGQRDIQKARVDLRKIEVECNEGFKGPPLVRALPS